MDWCPPRFAESEASHETVDCGGTVACLAGPSCSNEIEGNH